MAACGRQHVLAGRLRPDLLWRLPACTTRSSYGPHGTLQCASEAWLDKFLTLVELAEHRQRAEPLPLDQMLKHLAVSEPLIAGEYR